MKPLFDIEKSKKLCPPNYSKGIRHVKRIVCSRDKVDYRETQNSRVLHVQLKQIGPLVASFEVNGFLHDQNPPTVMVDPDNSDRFIGLSGFHRNQAAEQLGWETMMYDVLEFDNPLALRTHKLVTSHVKAPIIPLTENDIVKQLVEAVQKKEIENNDYDIKLKIDEWAADKNQKSRNVIFRKFRKHISLSSSLKVYHSGTGDASAQEYAIKHNLPYDGDKGWNETGKLAYWNDSSTPKTSLYSAKKLSALYGGEDVYFYTWLSEPKEAPALYKQRKDRFETFENFIREDCQYVVDIAKKCGVDLNIEDVMKKHPFKFGAFAAQNITPTTEKNGGPAEDGPVNWDGTPAV